MSVSHKTLRLRFDIAEHGGDADISLTRAEFAQLQQKLAAVVT